MSLSVSLSHQFPGTSLDIRFDAPAGLTALFGRSGAGKTTLVNVIAGLLTPDVASVAVDGDVLVDTKRGINIPVHKRRVGYVFQEARLFPHLSVRQNLLYGVKPNHPSDRVTRDQVVDMLGIGDLLHRRPGRLSGGERQRVALGRALLSSPRLLLMDEPLAALDDARKAEILPYLERLRDEFGVPILYVSHSLAEVARLATTVVALENGHVVRVGPTAEVLSDPDLVPALGVREAGAILSGTVASHHPDGLSEITTSAGPLLLPQLSANIGSQVRVRIEAGDVILAQTCPQGISALNVLPARVEAVRQGKAGGAIVRLRAGDDALLSRVSFRAVSRLDLQPGQEVFAIIESVSVARHDIGADAGK